MYKPSVVFRFVDYLFCFRPPNRLFFRLKTISVESSIRHSVKAVLLIAVCVYAQLSTDLKIAVQDFVDLA